MRKADYLIHAGTKGQKWGVRHWQNKDGSFTEEGKYRYGRKKYPQEMKIYNIYNVSDSELRDKLNRARMEREYQQLMKKPESEGKKLLKKIFATAATSVGTAFLVGHGKELTKYGEDFIVNKLPLILARKRKEAWLL